MVGYDFVGKKNIQLRFVVDFQGLYASPREKVSGRIIYGFMLFVRIIEKTSFDSYNGTRLMKISTQYTKATDLDYSEVWKTCLYD